MDEKPADDQAEPETQAQAAPAQDTPVQEEIPTPDSKTTADVEPKAAPADSEPEQVQSDQTHGEEADFETEQTPADYSQYMPELKPKKKWLRVLGRSVLIIVVVAALGGGGYWIVKDKLAENPKSAQQTQKQTSQNSTPTDTNTKPYTSSDLNLSLNYPQSWTVLDNNGKLTVTSPSMQLTDADGQTQTGQVVMTIQAADAADFSVFKQGDATAVLDSQKIAYANPTQTQRADTYVSFLQYASTTAHGALDGIFVTGDFGYQRDQNIPENDVTKVDPDIRVTFVKCSTAACSSTTPLSVSSDMWNSASFSEPITNMIKSLAIQ